MKTETEPLPASEPRPQTAMVVLTAELIRRLDAEARRRTMSRSLLVREACEAHLRRLASTEAA